MFNPRQKVADDFKQEEEDFKPDVLLAQFRTAYVLSSDDWNTAEIESNGFNFGITINLPTRAYDSEARARIENVLAQLECVRDTSGDGLVQYVTIEDECVTFSYWAVKVNSEWDEEFVLDDEGQLQRRTGEQADADQTAL